MPRKSVGTPFKHRAAVAPENVVSPSLERQGWLELVVEALRTRFSVAGYVVPQKIRVSIGWPKRAASCGAIGECWSTEASSDLHAELFISPQLTDGARIVDVLTHEMVHATVGTSAGHGKLRCLNVSGFTLPGFLPTPRSKARDWSSVSVPRVVISRV